MSFSYLIRRLLVMIPILFIVGSIVFFIFTLVPGDPAQLYAGEEAPQEYVEHLRKEFGLDKPVFERYLNFIMGLARGNLGKSFFSGKPVFDEMKPRIINTFQLGIVSSLLAAVVGIIAGTLSGIKAGSLIDRLISVMCIGGISIPLFWLGLLLVYLFGLKLGWLPVAGKRGFQSMILPAITLSVFSIAFITRMARSCILEVIKEDYIRTARAKGLPESIVIFKHALKNAMIPLTTVIGLRLGYVLGGSVIVESIFAWPGLGWTLVNAIGQRDFPMIRGVILVFAITFVLINTLVDIIYSFVDPRISLR